MSYKLQSHFSLFASLCFFFTFFMVNGCSQESIEKPREISYRNSVHFSHYKQAGDPSSIYAYLADAVCGDITTDGQLESIPVISFSQAYPNHSEVYCNVALNWSNWINASFSSTTSDYPPPPRMLSWTYYFQEAVKDVAIHTPVKNKDILMLPTGVIYRVEEINTVVDRKDGSEEGAYSVSLHKIDNDEYAKSSIKNKHLFLPINSQCWLHGRVFKLFTESSEVSPPKGVLVQDNTIVPLQDLHDENWITPDGPVGVKVIRIISGEEFGSHLDYVEIDPRPLFVKTGEPLPGWIEESFEYQLKDSSE